MFCEFCPGYGSVLRKFTFVMGNDSYGKFCLVYEVIFQNVVLIMGTYFENVTLVMGSNCEFSKAHLYQTPTGVASFG